MTMGHKVSIARILKAGKPRFWAVAPLADMLTSMPTVTDIGLYFSQALITFRIALAICSMSDSV